MAYEYQDIINKLEKEKNEIGKIIDNRSFHGLPFGQYVEEYNMLNVCIEAIEKQVPLKIRSGHEEFCPYCDDDISPSDYYCRSCGQKLNWSGF